MVEHQPSKLDTWVRFPSPAFVLSDQGAWWVWRSWLARQIVALEIVGSSPSTHLFSY